MMRSNHIVFARTRWNYDSYTDYWRLVELSGFPSCYVDEIDPTSGNVYIVSPNNGEWPEVTNHWVHPVINYPSKFILWNLERPGDDGVDGYTQANHSLMDHGLFNAVAVSDRRLASDANLFFLPMGSHPKLGQLSSFKTHDIIHLSCYSNHRAFLFNNDPSITKTRLGKFGVAENGWGEFRHDALKTSRMMLCVHQDNYKYIEPLRYALAVAYGLPIVAEYSHDTFPYTGPGLYAWSDKDTDMLIVIQWVLDNYRAVVADVQQMYDTIMKIYPFRDCVQSFVDKLFPVV